VRDYGRPCNELPGCMKYGNFWTSLGTVATDDGSLLDGVSYRAV